MSETLTISLAGTTALPPGKVAAVVTSLEMRAPPALRADPPGTEAFALERLSGAEAARYLAIYRAIGERWLWFSRLRKARAELEAILADAAVEAHAVRFGARDVGLLELDFRQPGEAELAFFGLEEGVVGRGAGRWLMNRALERAWRRPVGRLWVHTCTLDHPGAVDFYRRSGFEAFERGIEVADDPRLGGLLAPDSAPHHPLLR